MSGGFGIGDNNKRYRGERTAGSDFFDDVMDAPSVEGNIFGDSLGLNDYDRIVATPTDEGVEVSMHCRSCSGQGTVVVPWQEIYACAWFPQTTWIPPDYTVSNMNRALFPNTRCKCNGLMAPMLQPGWCRKQLDDALARNPQLGEWLKMQPMVQHVAKILAQRQGR